MTSQCPEPGLYEDVPFEEYCQWEAINNSSLTPALKSPRHYKTAKEEQKEPTDAMIFGTLVHSGKLDPKDLLSRYAVMPDFTQELSKEYASPRASKEYKEKVAAWEAQQKDKTIVSQDDYDRMSDMCVAMDQSQAARAILSEEGPAEISMVWRDAKTGLLCKARIDKLAHKVRKAGDLKTCQSADEFEKDIARRSYHRQGAFYVDGLYELTGHWYDYWIVAVEKEKPYGVRSAPLDIDAIVEGRRVYRKALGSLKEAITSGVYEGYQSPQAWTLPHWARERLVLSGSLGTIEL